MNLSNQETCPSPNNTRTISLTQGQFAVVDAADYDILSFWRWRAQWAKCIRGFYAVRWDSDTKRMVQMHRVILGLEHGDGLRGDHVNHATLDNRRANLRVATAAQNSQNQSMRADNSSGFKGVSWAKRQKKWTAQIGAYGKKKGLGYFDSPEAAHEAYCAAAARLHGEFACAGHPSLSSAAS